jgi:hypothetical protein
MTKPQISLFLSHSSSDSDLARSLVQLFQRAFGLPAGKIRCSSVDGYRLADGELTDETLRREVFDAKTFVGLITPASVRSQYVLFELGARWGSGRRLRPLLAGGVAASKLGPPLSNLMCLDASNGAQMLQLITELAGELNVPGEPTSALIYDLQEVGKLARPKGLDSSVVRDICRGWAKDDDKAKRGDLQLLPSLLPLGDEILAFVGTKNYRGDSGLAITASGIAWKNPTDAQVNRIGWVDLATTTIIASDDEDRVTIRGKAQQIDLSQAIYKASALAELLRKIARRGTKKSE